MRMRTLSGKSAGAGHRAVSLHRDCVLVFIRAWRTPLKQIKITNNLQFYPDDCLNGHACIQMGNFDTLLLSLFEFEIF